MYIEQAHNKRACRWATWLLAHKLTNNSDCTVVTEEHKYHDQTNVISLSGIVSAFFASMGRFSDTGISIGANSRYMSVI